MRIRVSFLAGRLQELPFSLYYTVVFTVLLERTMVMRLSKDSKYYVIGFCIFLLLSFIITKWFVLPKFRYHSLPLSHRVASNCFTVKKALEVYYAKMSEHFSDNPIPGFITFLMDADSSFSDQAPVSPYKSEDDMSFYLFLPHKLESPSALLIGYTGPFETDNKQTFRAAIFLRGNEIDMVRLREDVLEVIIGKETFKKKKPDFYIWKKRSQYLDDISHKRK